jgi:hypothetical protein
VQVDVLYLDEDVCVLRVSNRVRDLVSGNVIAAGSSGAVSRDGCGDYWMPPERLVPLVGARSAGLRVLRGPYTLGGRTFDAVYVASSGAAARFHAAYDAETGLLVVQSSRAQGSAVPTVPAPTPLPDHVARVSGLTYACGHTLAYPGTLPIQMPCQQDIEVVERAPQWLRVRVVRQTASMMGPIPDVVETEDVITAGGYGGVYAAPAWLQVLRPGTILEDDTITGVRAWVDAVDGSSVAVVATSATQRIDYRYDARSGWLTRLVFQQRTGPSMSTLQLDLQQVR